MINFWTYIPLYTKTVPKDKNQHFIIPNKLKMALIFWKYIGPSALLFTSLSADWMTGVGSPEEIILFPAHQQ
jgi:hypothetical protein